jgi:hypothetical protein
MDEAIADSVGLNYIAGAESCFKRAAELYQFVFCQRLMHLGLEAARVGLDICPRYHADPFALMFHCVTVQIESLF